MPSISPQPAPQRPRPLPDPTPPPALVGLVTTHVPSATNVDAVPGVTFFPAVHALEAVSGRPAIEKLGAQSLHDAVASAQQLSLAAVGACPAWATADDQAWGSHFDAPLVMAVLRSGDTYSAAYLGTSTAYEDHGKTVSSPYACDAGTTEFWTRNVARAVRLDDSVQAVVTGTSWIDLHDQPIGALPVDPDQQIRLAHEVKP